MHPHRDDVRLGFHEDMHGGLLSRIDDQPAPVKDQRDGDVGIDDHQTDPDTQPLKIDNLLGRCAGFLTPVVHDLFCKGIGRVVVPAVLVPGGQLAVGSLQRFINTSPSDVKGTFITGYEVAADGTGIKVRTLPDSMVSDFQGPLSPLMSWWQPKKSRAQNGPAPVTEGFSCPRENGIPFRPYLYQC